MATGIHFLRDLAPPLGLTAACTACGCIIEFNTFALMKGLGLDVSIEEAGERLVCPRCGRPVQNLRVVWSEADPDDPLQVHE